jgi:hypothetical protein
MQDFFKQIWQVIVDSNLLNVVGAVLILLIGWLIALYASRRISGSLQKLTVRKDILPDGAEVPRISHADTLTGKIIYYVIMIFAVLGCFSVLNLNAAAAPLQDFISTVAQYAPNIVGALLLAARLGLHIRLAGLRAAAAGKAARQHRDQQHDCQNASFHIRSPLHLSQHVSRVGPPDTCACFLILPLS